MFYQLCSHAASRQYVKDSTDATPYLLDLLHDRNTEVGRCKIMILKIFVKIFMLQVQRVCDATLQLIGEISPEWSQKLMAEKFRFHNAQWLEMVQSHTLEELNQVLPGNARLILELATNLCDVFTNIEKAPIKAACLA